MPTKYGPTPSGGASSTATFRDATGATVATPDAAQTVEIVETAQDGTVLARTYMERQDGAMEHHSMWRAPLDEVSEPETSDQTKATWDVWVNDGGQYRLAATLPDLLAAIGFGDADGASLATQRDMVGRMMILPSWEAAPERLKTEAYQWLLDTKGNVAPTTPSPTQPEPGTAPQE